MGGQFPPIHIGGQVVEVLHASGHRVPLGPVGDPALARKVVGRSPVTGRVVVLGHVSMGPCVGFRDVSAESIE